VASARAGGPGADHARGGPGRPRPTGATFCGTCFTDTLGKGVENGDEPAKVG